MTARLILQKLARADAQNRTLTSEIQQTARNLSKASHFRRLTEIQWECELALLTAETLSVRDVVYFLASGRKETAESDLRLNEFVCTVALDGDLPETHFHMLTTRKDTRTRVFGDLMNAAVRGGVDVLSKILQRLPGLESELDQEVRNFRLGAALTRAVELGKTESLRLLLTHDIGYPGWQWQYDKAAMVRAFEIGDYSCAFLLYKEYNLGGRPDADAACNDACRMAIRNGHEKLVHLVAADLKGMPEAALEDACRGCSQSILDFLLDECIDPVAATTTTSTSNAIYWAARRGHLSVLDKMLETNLTSEPNILASIVDALAGAAFYSLNAVNLILEYAGCSANALNSTELGIAAFSEAVVLLMARSCTREEEFRTQHKADSAQNPSSESSLDTRNRSARFARLVLGLPQAHLALGIDVAGVNIASVFRTLRDWPAGVIAGASGAATDLAQMCAMLNRPGLFMLIRMHTSTLISLSRVAGTATIGQSLAMCQVLLDVEWAINDFDVAYFDRQVVLRCVPAHCQTYSLDQGRSSNTQPEKLLKTTTLHAGFSTTVPIQTRSTASSTNLPRQRRLQ